MITFRFIYFGGDVKLNKNKRQHINAMLVAATLSLPFAVYATPVLAATAATENMAAQSPKSMFLMR